MLWSFLMNSYDQQRNKFRGEERSNSDLQALSTCAHTAPKSSFPLNSGLQTLSENFYFMSLCTCLLFLPRSFTEFGEV